MEAERSHSQDNTFEEETQEETLNTVIRYQINVQQRCKEGRNKLRFG